MKRAIRALESPQYQKALSKPNSRLPPVSNRQEALAALKMLPINRLAFQVLKLDTEDAIKAQLKPKAGVPCLQISPNQQFEDDLYFCWFYEPVSITTYLYAVLALVAIFAVVLFPLWPLAMRKGVWYISMAFLGLIAAFFGVALIRLVFFCITYVVLKPGLWLFPNLFEDVGVVESFIPFYAWSGVDTLKMHQPKKRISKKRKAAKLEKKRLQELEATQKEQAGKVLQAKFEEINLKLKEIAEERAKAGKPMHPQEIQALGQQMVAQLIAPGLMQQAQAAQAAQAQQQKSDCCDKDHGHSHGAPVQRIVELEDDEE